MNPNENFVRVDQFLFAIRIFKSRTAANNAITEGKVKLNGENIKPSRYVHIGEKYSIKTSDRRITIQVSNIISKRVKYAEAILNYFDISTEDDKAYNANKQASSFYTGKRQSNVGRPTKKTQRDLNDFLNPEE